jgi:hypothetical protein
MLIKDLKDKYPLVYEAAMKNCNESCNENNTISFSFTWDDTPQGHNFWWSIDDEQFDKAKEICPHLFIESSGEFKVGDWVVVLPTDQYYFNAEQDKAQKLNRIKDNGLPYQLLFSNDSTNSYEHIRKATQAEIDEVTGVKSETMFRKGDYIVLLEGPKYDNDFKLYYCYKQRENSPYINPEIDCRGSETNGWKLRPIDKCYNNDWRYATSEEIAEYDRVGKPFDVTTMNMETKSVDMKAIQEEAKRRFPIGCKFINTEGAGYMLVQDDKVYKIVGNMIYASSCYGCLYDDGKWATLLSMPLTGVLNTSGFNNVGYVDASTGYNLWVDKADHIIEIKRPTPQPLLLNKTKPNKQLVNLK